MRSRGYQHRIRALALCASVGLSSHAVAQELYIQADLRAVVVNSPLESFTEGGLGLLRFDEAHDGLQIGRVLIDAAGPLSETLHYTLTTSATDDGDQNPLDLAEAYVDWRPYPTSAWRWRTRAGAFYAPISLENRAIGWQSLYSLSPSAINTWVGEEMRTIGAEVATTFLGAQARRDFDVTFLAAAYAWNDPFGVLIFQRGWAIHDRQTPLFGDLPRPLIRNPDNRTIEFFDEIDDRIGYYVGAEVKWANDTLVRVMHYDNMGDPDDSTEKEPAWHTRFDELGVRLELPRDVTVLVQGMLGDTEAVPQGNGRGMFLVEFWSYYALVSERFGAHRFTARYDKLATKTERGRRFRNSAQDADAWTLAYMWDINDHWQVAVEALQIAGTLAQRTVVGRPARATEEQLQAAVRWTF